MPGLAVFILLAGTPHPSPSDEHPRLPCADSREPGALIKAVTLLGPKQARGIASCDVSHSGNPVSERRTLSHLVQLHSSLLTADSSLHLKVVSLNRNPSFLSSCPRFPRPLPSLHTSLGVVWDKKQTGDRFQTRPPIFVAE